MSIAVLSVQETQKLEKELFNFLPSIVYMENAGRSVYEYIKGLTCKNILIFAGPGNNGGDGFVIARHLFQNGYNVKIVIVGDKEKYKGDALIMLRAAESLGISIDSFCAQAIDFSADVIVDAIFGIGLNRELSGIFLEAIKYINNSQAMIISVDIPSGINANNGKVLGDCVKAHSVITFFVPKIGHLLFPARDYYQKLIVNTLGAKIHANDYQFNLVDKNDFSRLMPKREKNVHKGNFGKALLIAGSEGLVGAAIFCAKACLKSGIGLINAIIPDIVVPAVWSSVPGCMAIPAQSVNGGIDITSSDLIIENLNNKTSIAVGPGLGRKNDLLGLIKLIVDANLPTVIDADGLYALAQDISIVKNKHNVVITPHYAEMARLCKCSIEEIAEDPIKTATGFAKNNGITVLLKGSTTVIASYQGKVMLNTSGTAALAKGGSGDILTGILLAFLSKMPVFEAAYLASFLLGKAAECCTKAYESTSAEDIIECLSDAILDMRNK